MNFPGPFGPYETAEDIPEDEKKYYFIGDKFRPIESIDFVEVNFNERWPVMVPRFLAEYHGWWGTWEKDRNASMAEHLRPGMTLYDVGAFDGWLGCVYAQWVGGGQNMVLIEPVAEQWPNTKITWEANKLEVPRVTYMGFAGNVTQNSPVINLKKWPEGPDYSHALKGIKFKFLNEAEHVKNTSCIRLDDFAPLAGKPDAITIDVEGAGLIVLQGAEGLLREFKPLVWVAVHPEFMRDRFATEPQALYDFMDSAGYHHDHLGTDHEEHHLFFPR